MENILHSTIASQASITRKKSYALENFFINAETMRFGISPAILTFVVCCSSIAAAFAITSNIIQLSIVGFPTAIFISTIIAMAPMRIIFSLAAVTVLIDIAMVVIHLV